MPSLSDEIPSVSTEMPLTWRSHRDIVLRSGHRIEPGRKAPIAEASIRLLVIHFNPLVIATLRSCLQEHQDFRILAEASSTEDALTRIRVLQPDVILADIEMMGSALDIVRHCTATQPIVVFLSQHNRHALQAFDLGAVDFLLEPIDEDRFEISLGRVRERLASRRLALKHDAAEAPAAGLDLAPAWPAPARITVTDRRRTHVLDANDIEWIGAAGDYTELHVRGATHLLREPLSVLLGRLPADVFCRIHRSFVVNLNRVSGFKTLRNQDLLVKLKDKTVLRASRTFSDGLRRAITQQCA